MSPPPSYSPLSAHISWKPTTRKHVLGAGNSEIKGCPLPTLRELESFLVGSVILEEERVGVRMDKTSIVLGCRKRCRSGVY